MLRIIIDRGQSGGDVVKIIDVNNTVLARKRIDELPEKDDITLWEITLSILDMFSPPKPQNKDDSL